MSQDFNKGKIYKITNDYNDDIYVGSTCDTLNRRFTNHKAKSKDDTKNSSPIHKLMNEIGFERFRIESIEEYTCQDKYELRQKEGHFIREIGTLNKMIAGRTQKERKKENYESIKEQRQEYLEKNKEKIKKQQKEIYLNNKNKLREKITCECGSIFCKSDISRHIKTSKHQEYIKAIQTEVAH